jgi:CubicO group peptidase (beta-lactamase class C family)
VLVSRIEGKPFHQVLDERILQPLGMIDTGFFVSVEGRRRAATMYRLDGNDQLQHDVMGQPHIAPPAFCNAGGGLWSTADDYLRFVDMLMREGTLDGVRVLSPESVRLMRTDRLTAEQKRHSFLGAPFWIGRGFGLNLSVVTDPAKSAPLFGPGGVGTFSWPGAYGTWWQADPAADLILLYLIQNMPTLLGDAAAATIPAAWRPVAQRRGAFADEIPRPSGGSTPSRSWPERGDQPFAAPGWHRNDPAKTVTTIPRRAVSKLISLLMGRSRRSNDVRHVSGGRPTSVATGVPSKSRIG